MRDIPAFVMNASNVYRTRDYIVKQAIEIQHDSVEAGNVFSYDTFYKRTPARDPLPPIPAVTSIKGG